MRRVAKKFPHWTLPGLHAGQASIQLQQRFADLAQAQVGIQNLSHAAGGADRLTQTCLEFAHPQKLGFVALMIDHGFAFNGPHWDFPDSPIQGLYTRKMVYQTVRSLDDLQPWLDQVVHFPEEMIDQAYKQMPPEWIEGEEEAFEQLLERLLRRRKLLPDLIADCRKAKSNPFPQWK